MKYRVILASLLLAVASANGGTKELFFDWEDGTTTTFGEFIAGEAASVSYANVTTGTSIDYGPSAEPFATPVSTVIAPPQGSRMLEVNVTVADDDSDAVVPYLAYVENLNNGDTVQMSYQVYDPSDGRSPSGLVSGVYAQNGDSDSFAGFFTPFQTFLPGTGWLTPEADFLPDGTGTTIDPNLVFDDEGDPDNRQAVTMRATLFRPTLSTSGAGGPGNYQFYIDDMRIQVTSENPLAQITMPDGSVTLVNSVGGLTCDFDGDGDCDPTDLDQLYGNFGAAGGIYDVDASGTVDAGDIGEFLAQASNSENPFNTANKTFTTGDVDFNGTVDSTDLGILLNNFGDSAGLLYGSGNLNDDANVDSGDLGLLLNNFGFESPAAAAAVPEPSTGGLLLLALCGFLARRKQR